MREANSKRLAYWVKVCFGLGTLIIVMLAVDALVTQGSAESAKGQAFFLLITAFCIIVIGFNLRHILKDENQDS